jgi:hypothetical protein
MNFPPIFRRLRKSPRPLADSALLADVDSYGYPAWIEDENEPPTETRRAAESGYQPHGIASPETLAGLVAQAQAEAASGVRVPAYVPQALTWTAWTGGDAPEPPPMPCSGVSSIWVSQITYPEPGDLSYDHGRNYRETLRHIGKATGTSTSLENTASWARPALEAGWEAYR